MAFPLFVLGAPPVGVAQMGVDAETRAFLASLFDDKLKGLEARIMDEVANGLRSVKDSVGEVKDDVAKLADGLDRVKNDVERLDYSVNKISLQASRFNQRLNHLEYIPPGGGYASPARGFSQSPQGLPGQGLLETDSDLIDAPPFP